MSIKRNSLPVSETGATLGSIAPRQTMLSTNSIQQEKYTNSIQFRVQFNRGPSHQSKRATCLSRKRQRVHRTPPSIREENVRLFYPVGARPRHLAAAAAQFRQILLPPHWRSRSEGVAILTALTTCGKAPENQSSLLSSILKPNNTKCIVKDSFFLYPSVSPFAVFDQKQHQQCPFIPWYIRMYQERAIAAPRGVEIWRLDAADRFKRGAVTNVALKATTYCDNTFFLFLFAKIWVGFFIFCGHPWDSLAFLGDQFIVDGHKSN